MRPLGLILVTVMIVVLSYLAVDLLLGVLPLTPADTVGEEEPAHRWWRRAVAGAVASIVGCGWVVLSTRLADRRFNRAHRARSTRR